MSTQKARSVSRLYKPAVYSAVLDSTEDSHASSYSTGHDSHIPVASPLAPRSSRPHRPPTMKSGSKGKNQTGDAGSYTVGWWLGMICLPVLMGFVIARTAIVITNNRTQSEVLASLEAIENEAQMVGDEGLEPEVSTSVESSSETLANTVSPSRTSQEGIDALSDPLVQTKLRLLSDEHYRVKRYESQIKKRLESLDTALDELDGLAMDDASVDQSVRNRAKRGKLDSRLDRSISGIGGGDVPEAPVIHLEGSKAKKRNSSFRSSTDGAKLENSAFEDTSLARQTGNTSQNSQKATAGQSIPLLISQIESQLLRINSTPLGAPVFGTVTSTFGWRSSPYSRSGGHMHAGIDFSVEPMAPVVATAEGVVLDAGYKGAYGNCVVIKHRNGYETLYGHLAKLSVKPGDKVCRGERVGYVGNTGRSTGPHLHYEVKRHGEALNPQQFVEFASLLNLVREDEEQRNAAPEA